MIRTIEAGLYFANGEFARLHAFETQKRGDLEGALELIEVSLKMEPDNIGYKLDAAELSIDAGLYSRAHVLLTEVMLLDIENPEIYALMGRLMLAGGDAEKAKRALAYGMQGTGTRSKKAMALLKSITGPKHNGELKRHEALLLACAEKGHNAMRDGNYLLADKYFKRCIAFDSKNPGVLALAAYNLCLSKDEDSQYRALRYVRDAEKLLGKKDDALCDTLCFAILAYANAYLGRKGATLKMLNNAVKRAADIGEISLCVFVMAKLKLYKRLLEFVKKKLAVYPLDKVLLNAYSYAAYLLKLPKDEYTAGWLKILKHDPGDIQAELLLEYAANGTLAEDAEMFKYEPFMLKDIRLLPEYPKEETPKYISKLKRDWKRSPALRRQINYLLSSGMDEFGSVGLSLLSIIDNSETMNILNVYSLRPDVSRVISNGATFLLRERGYGFYNVNSAIIKMNLPDMYEIMEHEGIKRKSVVEEAAAFLEHRLELPFAGDFVAYIWKQYLGKTDKPFYGIANVSVAAAALSCLMLKEIGVKPNVSAMALHFGTTVRQIHRAVLQIDSSKLL